MDPSLASNAPTPSRRVSQRQPLACRECTKSKRKCSKTIPCTRCRRLNLTCSREIVQLRRNTAPHGAEIDFLHSLVADLDLLVASTPATSPLPGIISRVRSRIAHLRTDDGAPRQQLVNTPTPTPMPMPMPMPTPPSGRNEGGHLERNPSLLTAIEHLAWGRDSAGCFPHLRCGCQYGSSDAAHQLALHGSLPITATGYVPNAPRVDMASAEKLIRFHLCHMAWHHNCVHTPTFLEQCEIFWKTGRPVHPLWMALYFSILSSTVFAIRISARAQASADVDLDLVPPADELMTAMVEALHTHHFLEDMSLYSVQAIVISTEVAHNLGRSQLNATLFNAAVRIAECLGLHRIKDSSDKSIPTEEIWIETVQREVGKRVWCQMVIQDNFAIPFTDTYSISPMQYSTVPHLNADDYDLLEMPRTVPTVSTYTWVLRDIAVLMPSLADGLGPMSQPRSRREQYEHVLSVDNRMRSVVKQIPSFLLGRDAEKEAEIPWLGIARRSLAITAAEKIIMIHRPFLFLSFQSPSYEYTRRTCVAAAITILREHEMIINEGDFFVWTHSAFCVTAAIILCFQVSASSSTDPATNEFRLAIWAARNRLAAQTNDVLAQRGVALIDAIFSSEANPDLDFYRAVAEFLRLSQSTPKTSETTPVFADLSDPHAIGTDVGPALPIRLDRSLDDDDFETWFNNIFYQISGEQTL
ncbi:hypothetical protein BO70DRAFT_291690 [Aspergillus heteromorphus CBS 117.55]|uniref:Zn(2)-C6 fungal-type domain-containing protein n=1 Tax=Aspergillus heteromorphus CBS 117.55 TaxID=1448321 RepID=A0A317W6N2_9EURO|nr:uncharacterized protein BO70DRAFT_291690 [Aspergillus heteromorphus CBS 117.55]PWY82023.1 hypothetical protein BO70DRAFT_291690 [Aspergillus heteromorphus CBS 117.55]